MSEEFNLNEIMAWLRATPTLLQTILEATPDRLAHYQPTPMDWSINEVIGHLIEAERRGFAGRIRLMLTEEQHTCIGWDQDQVARDRHDNDKAMTELLHEFVAMRQESLSWVAALQPAQLQRIAQHPKVGMLSVRDLLSEWAYHDLNHLKQIESSISAWIWPRMGNAQQFYV